MASQVLTPPGDLAGEARSQPGGLQGPMMGDTPDRVVARGLDRRASSPFGEGRPTPPRTPEPVQSDTTIIITSV